MLLSRHCSLGRQACTRGPRDRLICCSVSTVRRSAALQTCQYRCSVSQRVSGCSRSGTICQAAADVSSAAATSTILYVSKLDPTVKGDELTSHFKDQPGFESAFVMNVADEDGQQECLGYIQFSNPQAAAAAQKALDGSELRQKRIKVRAQRGGSADEGDVRSTDAAEASGPATPEHTAATTAGSEATSSSATAADGSAEEDAGSGAEKPAGMSRSKKHRLRQNAKKEGIPKPAPNVLFVPSLRSGTTEEQLIECFGEQPGYQSIHLRNRWGRRNDAYVTFDSAPAAAAAMEALQGTSVNNLPMKIHVHELLSREKKSELAAANLAKSQTPPRAKPAVAAATAAAATAGGASSTKNNGSSSDSSSTKLGGRNLKGSKPRVTYSVKVLNLAWSTDADCLSAHFSECPGFVDAKTLVGTDNRATGIGYVRFATPEAAKAAIEAKDQTELDGRTIKVFISQKESAKFEAAAAAAAAASNSGKGRQRKGGKKAWAIQVSSLAWETTEDDLVEHFKDCPGYTGAFIVTSKDNRPSGIGYVTFDSNEAQLKALEAKQDSELVGRSIKLTLTRTGHVESSKATDDAAASGAATSTGTEAALEKTDIVLTGLPPSFTYKEVLGLCSYFGEVKSIVRMKGRYKDRKDSSSSSSSSAKADSAAATESGAAAEAEAGQVAAKAAAESATQDQPCFVIMGTAKAAKAAVGALNGRTVQGCVLKAALATPKKVARKRKASKAAKQEGEAADAQAAESKADAPSS